MNMWKILTYVKTNSFEHLIQGEVRLDSPSAEWAISSSAIVWVHLVNSEVVLNTISVLPVSEDIDTTRPSTVSHSTADTKL